MALFGSKKSLLKSAIKQVTKARNNKEASADQLYLDAYQGFADVIKGDLIRGEALYNWGFALLHQAKSKTEENSIKLYLEAINKFTFCLLVEPNHLGAAIDGGVAYMDLARLLKADSNDELYDLAGEFFANSERIQRGSAAYNLACIYALREQEDGCLEALRLSRECGSLPETEDMLSDVDILKVKDKQWFLDFIEKVKAGPEPEVVDKNAVTYDVEGNVINKNKKKKQVEFEAEDGTVYDAEGNVLREPEGDNSTELENVNDSPDSPVKEEKNLADKEGEMEAVIGEKKL